MRYAFPAKGIPYMAHNVVKVLTFSQPFQNELMNKCMELEEVRSIHEEEIGKLKKEMDEADAANSCEIQKRAEKLDCLKKEYAEQFEEKTANIDRLVSDLSVNLARYMIYAMLVP